MSSGFVTESEVTEARNRRQEQWDRVRQPEDPLECPQEPYDGRSLYDRLKEQKIKKDMVYEEAHKLKNLIRGLDDDEIKFLQLVDQQKITAERKQVEEDEQELKEFRNRVVTLQEDSINKRIKAEFKSTKLTNIGSYKANNLRPSQKALLGISIKRKNCNTTPLSQQSAEKFEKNEYNDNKKSFSDSTGKKIFSISSNRYDQGALKCVAILPGIGSYTESSDSEVTSGSDDDIINDGKYDLCGRMQQKKKECTED